MSVVSDILERLSIRRPDIDSQGTRDLPRFNPPVGELKLPLPDKIARSVDLPVFRNCPGERAA